MYSNKLDKMFSNSDSDGDGKLNFAEFMTAGQKVPGGQSSETSKTGKPRHGGGHHDLLQQLMELLDSKGTDKTSSTTKTDDSKSSDISDLKSKAEDTKNQIIKDLFAALDTIRDQNKSIKAKSADGKTSTSREDLFKAIDKDNDGSLTKDEVKTFHDQKINEARAAILQVQELFSANQVMGNSAMTA